MAAEEADPDLVTIDEEFTDGNAKATARLNKMRLQGNAIVRALKKMNAGTWTLIGVSAQGQVAELEVRSKGGVRLRTQPPAT